MKKLLPLLLTAFVLSGCNSVNRTEVSSPTPIAATSSPTAEPQTQYEFVATESGQLALDLLTSQAEVETQDYGSAGKFVTSINGLAGNNNFYWAFYLNGEYAEQGASQTELAIGDIIKFEYEAVTPAN